VLGVTYKRDVADLRESSALPIMERLVRAGADVRFSDPFINSVVVGKGKLTATPLTSSSLNSSDLVVVHTDHSSYDWGWIEEHSRLILDTRRAYKTTRDRVVRL
jgi:UDP-N-acetyl-D-glucosamine dehydrogenase